MYSEGADGRRRAALIFLNKLNLIKWVRAHKRINLALIWLRMFVQYMRGDGLKVIWNCIRQTSLITYVYVALE